MAFEKGSIGVLGHGFVGEALSEGMQHAFKVRIFDPKYLVDFIREPSLRSGAKGTDTKAIDVCRDCEVVFVCVPTPMNANGSCNTTIVERVVKEIDGYGFGNVVVIKSTVPPGTTRKLQEESKTLTGVVFNPEFLTEANYINDFKNQNRIIIGGEEPAKSIVKHLYDKAYPKTPVIKTSSTIAEMVKYLTNCFLATKLSFANEMFQVCQALGIDFDKVTEYARYDERLGKSHWAVPGGDGKFGWGLSCFPKDLNAMMFKAKELGVDPKVLSAVWQKNLEVRPECDRDWEKMSKAVTNPKGNGADD